MSDIPKKWFHIDLRQSFMIFNILLLGVFLVASLAITDYILNGFDVNSVNKTIVLRVMDYIHQLKALENLSLLTPFIIFIFYALGVTVYLFSFLLISAPTAFISDWLKKRGFPERLQSKKILTIIGEILDIKENELANETILFSRGFLYLYLQQNNTPVSSDLKFTFSQIMYGRTVGLILLINLCWVFFNKFDNPYIASWLLAAVWITIVGAYIAFLLYFEDMLRMSYYAEQQLEKKQNTPKKINNKKETSSNDSQTL